MRVLAFDILVTVRPHKWTRRLKELSCHGWLHMGCYVLVPVSVQTHDGGVANAIKISYQRCDQSIWLGTQINFSAPKSNSLATLQRRTAGATSLRSSFDRNSFRIQTGPDVLTYCAKHCTEGLWPSAVLWNPEPSRTHILWQNTARFPAAR